MSLPVHARDPEARRDSMRVDVMHLVLVPSRARGGEDRTVSGRKLFVGFGVEFRDLERVDLLPVERIAVLREAEETPVHVHYPSRWPCEMRIGPDDGAARMLRP